MAPEGDLHNSLPPTPMQTGEVGVVSIRTHQLLNSVLAAVLVAVVLGSDAFYVKTVSDISSLQSDLERIEEKVDTIYEIVDRAHPRQGTPPP